METLKLKLAEAKQNLNVREAKTLYDQILALANESNPSSERKRRSEVENGQKKMLKFSQEDLSDQLRAFDEFEEKKVRKAANKSVSYDDDDYDFDFSGATAISTPKDQAKKPKWYIKYIDPKMHGGKVSSYSCTFTEDGFPCNAKRSLHENIVKHIKEKHED